MSWEAIILIVALCFWGGLTVYTIILERKYKRLRSHLDQILIEFTRRSKESQDSHVRGAFSIAAAHLEKALEGKYPPMINVVLDKKDRKFYKMLKKKRQYGAEIERGSFWSNGTKVIEIENKFDGCRAVLLKPDKNNE